jgi:hypothetical protein
MNGKVLIGLFLLLNIFTSDCLGQNLWLKTFGGSSNEEGSSIICLKDSTYVMIGGSSSTNGELLGLNKGGGDVYVHKLQSNSKKIWIKTYGGTRDDYGKSITTSNDGGYVITGYTKSSNGDFSGMNNSKYLDNDIYVIKIDTNGKIEWKKTFGGILDDRGYSITKVNDGGFVVTGYTDSPDGDFKDINKSSVRDIFAIKLDENGNLLWKRTFGGSMGIDFSNQIIPTSDGGCIITGNTSSNDGDFAGLLKGVTDVFVIKLNQSGIIQWKKTYGGSNSDYSMSIQSHIEGGYVLTGYSDSRNGDFDTGYNDYDVFVLRIDDNGNKIWSTTFGGTSSDYGNSIIVSKDGNILVTGFTNSYNGVFSGLTNGKIDCFVTKLNNSGKILWNRVYGGDGDDYGNSIVESGDGGYTIIGRTTSDDNSFINSGGSDIFVMKLNSNGNLTNTSSTNEFNEPTTTLSVHPNPFSNTTTISYKVETPSNISIELLNTLGQTIEVLRNDYSDSGTYQLPLNVSNLTSGMYSMRMRSGSNSIVVPVWVVK